MELRSGRRTMQQPSTPSGVSDSGMETPNSPVMSSTRMSKGEGAGQVLSPDVTVVTMDERQVRTTTPRVGGTPRGATGGPGRWPNQQGPPPGFPPPPGYRPQAAPTDPNIAAMMMMMQQQMQQHQQQQQAIFQQLFQQQKEDRAAQEDSRKDERAMRSEEINAFRDSLQQSSIRVNPTPRDDYRLVMKSWDEGQDLDEFLDNFERTAATHSWSIEKWATRLANLLSGRAKSAYLRIPKEEAGDYETIKKALLEEYRKTPDSYRRLFREAKKTGEENFKQFAVRQKLLYDRWLETAEVEKSYDAMYQHFLLEQLLSTMIGELAEYVIEKEPTTAKQAAEIAFLHLKSRREARLNVQSANRTDDKRLSQKAAKTTDKSGVTKTSDQRANPRPATSVQQRDKSKITCHKCGQLGHYQRECTQVTKSDAVRTRRAKDVPEQGLQPLCQKCEEVPFHRYVTVQVNGTSCTAMRDSGADTIIVKPRFVKDEDYTDETEEVTYANNTLKDVHRKAFIDLNSPYVRGRVKAIVMNNMEPDIFIGEIAFHQGGKTEKVPVYPKRSLIYAVTRAQEKKGERTPIPVQPIDGLDVTPVQLKRMQRDDETLKSRWELAEGKEIAQGKDARVSYKVSRGVLKREFKDHTGVHTQVCVPKELREAVMKLGHDTPMSGHMAAKRTRERIWGSFYWPGMCADIQRYCRSCDRCQRVTPKGRVSKVPLLRMPLSHIPFEKVAVDLIGPIIPASDEGHRYVLVMVDYATRWPEAVPLKNIDTETVAEALWVMWSRLGIPKEVLSDRGTQFTSECMTEIHRLLAIKGLRTTPYHAQCNGLVERFNGTLKAMLRKLAGEQPRIWHKFIPALLFSYREVPQESTGFTPFELLYGRTVRGPLAVLRDLWTKEDIQEEVKTTATYVLDLRNRIEETCKIARENLERQAVKYKKYFDRKAKARSFKEGDKVLLLLPEKQNKLEMCWRGPFAVEERVGEADYRIRIRNKAKLFHANMLKLYVERTTSNAIAVIDEREPWEEVRTTKENIPLIPLVADETIEDIHLDPDSPEAHAGIKEILQRHQKIVTDLPQRTKLATCVVELEHDRPVRVRQYPLPYTKQEVIGKEVEAMLRMGVIESSTSPYASPIVLVTKHDGKIRFCSDYRAVNRIVVFNAEPMPDVEYILSKIGKAKYFSKIDLCKGYWQIPMAEEDKVKTAFTTPQGSFQWTVMPFGLKTAGAIFTKMMRNLLSPLRMPEIDNFIDDIMVATETLERHLECLEALFARLEEVNLAARPSKCYLGYRHIEYLGYQIGEGKISPMEAKLEKIGSALKPTTKKQLRSFLGLAGFYRKFVADFACIAKPLTDATKKQHPNNIVWTPEMETAFNTLKSKLTSKPICVLPDMKLPFVMRTDASDYGLGVLLLQDQGEGLRLVACASKKLNSAELNYSVIEKECLAIVWGVSRFAHYLHGCRCTIQSDHRPLEYLQGMKAKNKRLMRWALQLQPYDIVIQAIPGSENVGADFLSRNLRID